MRKRLLIKQIAACVFGLFMSVVVYFGVAADLAMVMKGKQPKAINPKSITVLCRNGYKYTERISNNGNFQCDWKELVFNY